MSNTRRLKGWYLWYLKLPSISKVLFVVVSSLSFFILQDFLVPYYKLFFASLHNLTVEQAYPPGATLTQIANLATFFSTILLAGILTTISFKRKDINNV